MVWYLHLGVVFFSQGLSSWDCCYGLFWTDNFLDCMASSLSGRDEPNPAMWLVTRAGKMALSCAFLITRCIPHEKRFLFKYNKSFVDQAWSVKMAGYCSCSFYCVFMEVDLLSPLIRWINNLANIQPSWFSLLTNIPCFVSIRTLGLSFRRISKHPWWLRVFRQLFARTIWTLVKHKTRDSTPIATTNFLVFVTNCIATNLQPFCLFLCHLCHSL